MVSAARTRLAALWISQVARSLADFGIGLLVAGQLTGLRTGPSAWVWPGIVGSLLAPFLLLAPLNGALRSILSPRWLLAGASLWSSGATVFLLLLDTQQASWLGCLGLAGIAVGSAVYRAAAAAMLPLAAQECQLPLNRVTACFAMGTATALAATLLLGGSYFHAFGTEGWRAGPFALPAALMLALNVLAILAALPVQFVSEGRRPAFLSLALAQFFRDSRAILKNEATRQSLFGLAYFLGLILAAALVFRMERPSAPVLNLWGAVPLSLGMLAGGGAIGALLAGVQGHPRRVLGLVPPASLALLATVGWAARGDTPMLTLLVFGFLGGMIHVPLRTAYLIALPEAARGNGLALLNAAEALSCLLLPLGAWATAQFLTPVGAWWLLAGLVGAGGIWAWRTWLREVIEQLGEILIWPLYRIRMLGPGCTQLPLRGPLLVIANHTAWFDPLWLAKVLPRRLTPMMTSRFFDLPVLHWLMRHVAGAIRVQAAAFRRSAPELQEAIAVLDRGGCVLLFPEGFMKRTPEQTLRHFGQGIWRILQQRPETPLVVCWIEGGWGSFTSYWNGPPATHKRLDWWRPIAIAVEPPQLIDPALLADQQATRTFLMEACAKARRHLGLPPLALQRGSTLPPDEDRPQEVAEPL